MSACLSALVTEIQMLQMQGGQRRSNNNNNNKKPSKISSLHTSALTKTDSERISGVEGIVCNVCKVCEMCEMCVGKLCCEKNAKRKPGWSVHGEIKGRGREERW